MAGLTSDANLLTNELRLIGQRYKYSYGESIPCEQLVSWLCDIKQLYTQSGGKRPFGVSILYMGWDKHYGFQLYQSDPSGEIVYINNEVSDTLLCVGNYGGWKATCIGNNWNSAVSMLKQEYKENETSLQDALDLSIKVLSKTLDMTKLTPEKIELATLTRENNKTQIKILPADKVTLYISNSTGVDNIYFGQVEELIKKYEKAEAEAEAAKKEKEKEKSQK